MNQTLIALKKPSHMKLKLFLFLLLLNVNLFAQNGLGKFSVKWGPQLKGTNSGSISDLIGMDDDFYYFGARLKNDLTIEKLDKNLDNPVNFIFEEKNRETKERFSLFERVYFADRLYVFKTNIDKDTKTTTLLAEEVNKKTMTSVGSDKKIAAIQYEKRREKGDFSIYTSANDSYLMVIEEIPVEKDENEKFNVIMFDNALNITWKKNIQLPYQNTLFRTNKFMVDDNGNFYVLGILYRDKDSWVKKEVNYTHHIIVFNDQGNSTIDYEVKLKDKFIADITFRINKDGDITCAGFYSNLGKGGINGAFFLTLDPISKQVKASNFKEFDMDFMTEYMTEKEEKKAKKNEEKGKEMELGSYHLRSLIKRSDGGAILVAEQIYIYTYTYPCGNNMTCSATIYNYNDIIVVNIDAEGKIEWSKKVPKRQRSKNDGGSYSSFALMVTDDFIGFIYNDHRDNLEIETTRNLKNFNLGDRNGIVTIARINNQGKLTRETLFDNKEVEVVIQPRVCEQVDDNNLMIFGQKRKYDQFGIVSFN